MLDLILVSYIMSVLYFYVTCLTVTGSLYCVIKYFLVCYPTNYTSCVPSSRLNDDLLNSLLLIINRLIIITPDRNVKKRICLVSVNDFVEVSDG